MQNDLSSLVDNHSKVVEIICMGHFKSGQQKPTGSGRRKGTPNTRTQQLLDSMKSTNFSLLGEMQKLLPQLPVEKRVDVLLELMPYAYPKRKPSEDSPAPVADNRPRVIVTIPSNGRQAPGTELYTEEEAKKILGEK